MNIKGIKFTTCFWLILSFWRMESMAQSTQIIHLTDLQRLLNPQSDSTYIINFMATWCRPCMEEIPSFEKLSENFKSSNLKVMYISLDVKEDVDTKLNPILKRKGIHNQTFLLDEINYNSWIDEVEKSWDGALPVTFIINHDKHQRRFIAKETTYEELSLIVNEINNLK